MLKSSVVSDFPIIIDWLTFSLKISSVDDAITLLGLDNNLFIPTCGRWFYQFGLTYQNIITIYYGQQSDSTACCINVSGQGVRYLESFSSIDLIDLLHMIHINPTMNISRIDLAMDVIDSVDIKKFVDSTEKGFFKCRSKFYNHMHSCDDGIEAHSLYFGRQASNIFINIYDKRAERGFKIDDHPSWVRIEIRLRHENAEGFLYRLFFDDLNIGTIYSGILNNYLTFLKPTKADSNKSRWDTASWWKKLLQHTDKISVFYKAGVEYNYTAFEENFIKRCGSSIKTYLETNHTPFDLVQLLDENNVELNAKQQFIVDNYESDIDFKLL